VRGAPPALIAELEAAIRAEREARAALTAAQAAHRDAVARTTGVASELRAVGCPMTDIALVVAREIGLTGSVSVRRKLAARFRKRAARRRVTERPTELGALPPHGGAPRLPLNSEVHEKESAMAKLIKKTTVTEEFVEDTTKPKKAAQDEAGDDDLDGLEDLGDEDEDDDEDDDRPRRSRRRAR